MMKSTKRDFLKDLRKRLSGLPRRDADERVSFYGELIDDRMEEGLSEADAVAAVGDVEKIAAQVLASAQEEGRKVRKPRRLQSWELVLLIAGAPLWLPLLLAAVSVVLSVFVAFWAIIASLWAAFAALALSGIAAVPGSILLMVFGNGLAGLLLLSGGLLCLGLACFAFLGCFAATRGGVLLMKLLLPRRRREA
jgi:uncharacterized membrane protein